MPPIKALWEELLKKIVVIVGVCLMVASVPMAFLIRNCDSDATGPDHLEDAQREILDGAAREREENDRRIGELEDQLYDLRIRVENLDAEIAEGAKYREEVHDAIDHAISIDDIDRILRGGIPGVSGRRDR